MNRGVEKRRKRPYGEEARLPGYLANSYFCCEAVNRLRDDINCLCQDVKRLAKVKSEMEDQHRKFEVVCLTARQKLKSMAGLKVQQHARTGVLTEMKAIETRDFLKYTWSLANSALDKKAQKSKFMSIRGNRAVEYVDELITMSDSILTNYGNEFVHGECTALYTHLNRQLQCLLAPEMLKADAIEFSNTYINAAMPAMVNLMSIIDLYLQYPRLSDVITLCNEIFHKSPSVSNRPCKTLAMRALASLLRGTLVGEKPVTSALPVVEGRVTNFCRLATETAQYILSKSALVVEPPSSVPLVLLGPGLLDPKFQNNLPPKKTQTLPIPPQLPPVPVPPGSPVPVPGPTRPTPSRGRGRPRKRAQGPSERPTTSRSPTTNETGQCPSPTSRLLL